MNMIFLAMLVTAVLQPGRQVFTIVRLASDTFRSSWLIVKVEDAGAANVVLPWMNPFRRAAMSHASGYLLITLPNM